MAPSGPDASNSCLPPTSPVYLSIPPLPSATRGEPCVLDGKCGRLNGGKPIFGYASGRLVVVRSLGTDPLPNSKLPVLVYRGHQVNVSAVKFSPSGAYVASGDSRGKFRVWAFDHEEHLCRLDIQGLSGLIRDVDWDFESKRLAFVGERNDSVSECARVLQWDTGVTCGNLAQHVRGRAGSVAFKPNRPMRIATGGNEDMKCLFNAGPPFKKVPAKDGVPAESCHSKAIHRVRYNPDGSLIASTGGDKSICLYDGKTMEFKAKLENVHSSPIYGLSWSADGKYLLTASGDGFCKLIEVTDGGTKLTEKTKWDCAKPQLGMAYDKLPKGCMQLGCTFVDGDKPISVGLNGQICVLPMPGQSGADIEVISGHNAPIAGVAVDHDSGKLYTGDTDGIICVWDLETSKPLKRLAPPGESDKDLMYQVHGGAISGLAVSEGSLMSVAWDDKMYVASKSAKINPSPIPLEAQPSAIATGSKLTVIITVEGIIPVKNGAPVSAMVKYQGYTGLSVCVSKDDSTVYVGGDDCKIHIFEANGLKEKHVIENGHLKPVYGLSLSNDGTKLASSDVRDVCVWDISKSYAPIISKSRWCFHLQRITCLSWSPDDKLLASGGSDDSIYLWSLEKKMRRIHYPYAHRGGIMKLEFLKKSGEARLVSVGADSVVQYWDFKEDAAKKFG